MYEIWHKVLHTPLAQGLTHLVFHDAAQGPHKVSDDIFPIEGITASRHIYIYIYIYYYGEAFIIWGGRPGPKLLKYEEIDPNPRFSKQNL